ncbi:hypothetical protein SCA6_016023, partial [Theobroma cacao]
EGATVYTSEGNVTKCSLEAVVKVQNPQFYWKVMTEADLGLAEAFINGDFLLLISYPYQKKATMSTGQVQILSRNTYFPGGCVPSLNRIISAMAAASRL